MGKNGPVKVDQIIPMVMEAAQRIQEQLEPYETRIVVKSQDEVWVVNK